MAPSIRYTVTLWADLAVEDGVPAYTPREFEKHLMKVLSRADAADIDLEVVKTTAFDDDDGRPPHDDEHERAAERARANDFADTNGRDWT